MQKRFFRTAKNVYGKKEWKENKLFFVYCLVSELEKYENNLFYCLLRFFTTPRTYKKYWSPNNAIVYSTVEIIHTKKVIRAKYGKLKVSNFPFIFRFNYL